MHFMLRLLYMIFKHSLRRRPDNSTRVSSDGEDGMITHTYTRCNFAMVLLLWQAARDDQGNGEVIDVISLETLLLDNTNRTAGSRRW